MGGLPCGSQKVGDHHTHSSTCYHLTSRSHIPLALDRCKTHSNLFSRVPPSYSLMFFLPRYTFHRSLSTHAPTHSDPYLIPPSYRLAPPHVYTRFRSSPASNR